MSIDRISSKELPDYIKREDSPGFRFDSGPYIGKVKDNRDPERSGRIQVWIPELGGDETDPRFWRTVAYASPFLGATVQNDPEQKQNPGSRENKWTETRHVYGMWFNVPDLENLVLCTFVAGDATRGYYFACIPNQLTHHMVPGLASSDKVDKEKIQDSKIKSLYQAGKIGPELPVTEFNEYNKDITWPKFQDEKKPLHEPQVKILIEQGLDRPSLTKNRGRITTTSQRETPAGVFGISTPGRSIKEPPKQDDLVEKRKIKTRQGGHTFVMDDGDNSDQKGKNNLTRWRSSAGHTILMDDTDNLLYIINSNGTAYVEITGTGHINIYSQNSINIRTAADFNLHVDKDLNLQVDGNMNIKVKKDLNVETNNTVARSIENTTIFGDKGIKIGSENTVDLEAFKSGSFTTKEELRFTGDDVLINSGRGPKVTKPRDITIKTHPDTKKSSSGQWEIEKDKIKSVSKIVPTHEPWERKTGKDSTASNSPAAPSDQQSNDITQESTPSSKTTQPSAQSTQPSTGESSPGLESAKNTKLGNVAPPSAMKSENAPNHPNGFGDGLLSPDQAKALSVQLGYSESRNNYKPDPPNPYGFIGKYQMGAAALVDAGYIKRSAYEQRDRSKSANDVLNDPGAWTGKDGVYSKQGFEGSPSAQEAAHVTNTENIIRNGIKSGYISRSDDPGTVGGKVMAAHLLGVAGAKKWYETGIGQDANGATGGLYYNRGKYAVEKLADGNKG